VVTWLLIYNWHLHAKKRPKDDTNANEGWIGTVALHIWHLHVRKNKSKCLLLHQYCQKKVLQHCQKYLIPSIWNSRQTPMNAICISCVDPFLLSQNFASNFTVNRRMTINSVLWDLCYVDHIHRNFHSLHHFGHHTHHILVRPTSPVVLLLHWLCLIEAFDTILVAPVCTSENITFELLES